MSLSREPARPHDPGYPTSTEFDPTRRAALRAIALAGLSAAGLQLVGCPGGGGSSRHDTSWLPWGREEIPLAGAPPPQHLTQPVAIVVGGGPIDVVFSDGRAAKLAVALVVQPTSTPGGVKASAPAHVEAVKAAARSLPGTTCDTAQGLDALGARIQEEVLKATPGLVLEGVQAAPAREPAPQSEPSGDAGAARSAPAPAPPPAPPAPAEGAAAKPVKVPVTNDRVWVPCAKPGYTSCGTK